MLSPVIIGCLYRFGVFLKDSVDRSLKQSDVCTQIPSRRNTFFVTDLLGAASPVDLLNRPYKQEYSDLRDSLSD
jgi:hypothetical protein